MGYYAAPASRTISKHYLLTYKDGSRKHITRSQRDTLLLSRQAKRTESGNYFFIGQVKTFRNFIDLAQWFTVQKLSPDQIRRYLECLEVLWKLGSEQETQFEETPAGFERRLELMGMPEGGFEPVVMQAL